ncbi:response regulator [bacterium]|nr:response regulator [bacterium]
MSDQDSTTPTVPDESAMQAQQPDDMLVLIVDDEPLALDIAQMSLTRHGYKTETARNGEEGWSKVLELAPSIVLLDITMPDIDGFEVFERIRSHPATEALPVIFVTARDDLDHKVRGLELGAIDYITKPYNPNELVARVRTTLRLQRLEREARVREREEERRRAVEALLITLSHYINNAIAAIQGHVAVTPPDNPELVKQMMKVIKRQSLIVTTTIDAIEEMLEEVRLETTKYIMGDAEILDVEEMIRRRLDELDKE